MANAASPGKSIPEKLQMRPGRIVLFVNKPPGYDNILGRLPHGVGVSDESARVIDIVQVFVKSREELENELPKLKQLLANKGIIWVTYPRKTTGAASDINRDVIAAYAQTIGLESVALVSIDEVWSALRLKVVN